MKVPETHTDYRLVVFFCSALVVFLIVFFYFFIKRRIRIRIDRQSEIYRQEAHQILFDLLFGQATMTESLQRFRSLEQGNVRNKVFTQCVTGLQKDYSGTQREILEDFFVLSDLTAYSFKKLKSRKPADIISGMNALSLMNVREASEFMKLELAHPNDAVKKEAFIGLIGLEGMQGLENFPLPNIEIDTRTQERIIERMKNKRFTSFAGVHLLLYCENESLILLGARITEYFQLHSYYEYLIQFPKKLHPLNQKELDTIRKRISQSMNP